MCRIGIAAKRSGGLHSHWRLIVAHSVSTLGTRSGISARLVLSCGSMSLYADPRITAQLAAIERKLARLMRERPFRDKRDGRAVLAVRIGDELAALVRRTAQRQGRTISDLLRPAILAA